VVYASDAARQTLREESSIRLHVGRLRLQDKASQDNLDRLLTASFDHRNGHAPVTGGVVPIWRYGRTPLLLQVIPLHPDADSNLMAIPAHAALYLIDSELETEIDLDKLASLLDLTPAEARIAALISHGEKPADIAASCSVSIHTVRSQIKSIFIKTEVSSQAQLTKLVRALPVQRQVALSRTPFLLSCAG